MTKRILIGVTGGIAAYKICEVVSTLAKAGAEVRVILTAAAEAFVSPLTFATLARSPAYCDRDFWQPINGRPLHIELAEWADIFLIAPLSANTLAKLVYGLADNLLTNTILASQCPVLVAPAMNTTMWEQESVQRNWQSLNQNPRYRAIAPASGVLACDAVGTGRMAEPEVILGYIESLLWTKGKRDLVGKNVLVSAGGTREFLDPVRFIGNPATGKQGIAIAQAAHHRGAHVTLVTASSISVLDFVTVPVVTAAQMHEVMLREFPKNDLTIMAAAVGDARPQQYRDRKIPKAELSLNLALELIPDILADLSKHKLPQQLLVGFAAQTGTELEVINAAQAKLKAKNLDAIAANLVEFSPQATTGFAAHTNQATFLDRHGHQTATPLCSKLELAHRLLDFLQFSG